MSEHFRHNSLITGQSHYNRTLAPSRTSTPLRKAQRGFNMTNRRPSVSFNAGDHANSARDACADIEPLVVRPKIAKWLLGSCSNEHLYALLNSGAIESYRDGRSRLISVPSIQRYVEMRLASRTGPPASDPARSPPRRVGRLAPSGSCDRPQEPSAPQSAPRHSRSATHR